MAKVRVSTLAKEFGMTSKELMGHLADMKIPAKSASSTLEDAYVAMVRKQLASVIEARAQEVEAATAHYGPPSVYGKANTSGWRRSYAEEGYRDGEAFDVSRRIAPSQSGEPLSIADKQAG